MSINRKNIKSGFLLIEAIIALFLLSSLSLSLALWYNHIVNLNYYNYTKIKALSLALSSLEKYNGDININTKENSYKKDIYQVKTITKKIASNFSIVTVKVDWKVNNSNKSISLSLGVNN